jgi:DNA-binding transcriptional LysR family regulator
MRLDSFDLNLLVAFEALVQERSVTRAAARLNLTQSAMSAALNRLRLSFQDELLVQSGKKMIPTQHALALMPDVSDTLVRLKGLIAASTLFDPATSKRSFRVNASDYVTTVLLAPLTASLQKIAPNVCLLLSLPDVQSTARLESGEIDLLLSPENFMRSDHPRELLFEEDFVVVGSADNDLLESYLTLDAFLSAGHIIVRISNEDTFVERALAQLLPQRRIEVVAQSFIQAPWLLRGTNRLSVMHKRLAEVTAPQLGLKIAPLPIYLSPMEQMMQHHGARSRDAGLFWLRDQIRQFAAHI